MSGSGEGCTVRVKFATDVATFGLRLRVVAGSGSADPWVVGGFEVGYVSEDGAEHRCRSLGGGGAVRTGDASLPVHSPEGTTPDLEPPKLQTLN